MENHPHLVLSESNIVTKILLPLCGSEDFPTEEMDQLPVDLQLLPKDKQREPDSAIRGTHLETLLLFCTSRKCREALRDQNIYRVVQLLHLVETDERNKELATRLAGLLIRNEEASLQEANGDDIVEEV